MGWPTPGQPDTSNKEDLTMTKLILSALIIALMTTTANAGRLTHLAVRATFNQTSFRDFENMGYRHEGGVPQFLLQLTSLNGDPLVVLRSLKEIERFGESGITDKALAGPEAVHWPGGIRSP